MNAKDIQKQLRQFLSISSGAAPKNPKTVPQDWSTYSVKDLTETSTTALLSIPAARHAVMSFVGFLVHDSVHLYFTQLESTAPSASSSFDSTTVDETVTYFCTLFEDKMKDISSTWRTLVLKWSVDLLANISQANAGRRATTYNGAPKTLNELLQLYTGCVSVQNVAQLLKICIKDLLESDTEGCISTLVGSSKFGSHFDWVLSYVGTCFPQTIFSRLLSAGLEEFATHVDVMLSLSTKRANAIRANEMNEKYSQKIRSLSAIFGHLARQRSTELTEEIRQLITVGLSEEATRLEQRGIPFLFKLTTFSKELLQLVIKEMEDLLTVENLLTVARILGDIPPRLLVPDDKTTPDKLLVGMLSVLSQNDVVPLFERLMCLAFADLPPEHYRQNKSLIPVVRNQAIQIMEFFLTNLEIQVHGELAFSETDIPILDSVYDDLEKFVSRLYSQNDHERQYVFRLLVFVALAKGENGAVSIASLVIFSAGNDKQLEVFLALTSLLRPYYPDLCERYFEKFAVVWKKKADLGSWDVLSTSKCLRNIRTLLIWERNAAENSDAKLMKFRDSAQHHFSETAQFLLSVALTSSLRTGTECLVVLESIGACVHQLPKNSVLITQKLVQVIVRAIKHSETADGLELYWKSTEYTLYFLSTQATFCQEVFIRALMDIIFEDKESLFDSSSVALAKNEDMSDVEISLLEQNKRHSFWNRHATAMVHSGVIGQGLRQKKNGKVQEGPLFRRLLLLDVMDRFCQSNYKPKLDGISDGSRDRDPVEYSPAACKMLALLCTEKLCPDCIASEHIWEEWRYAKTNIERFLAVKKNVEKCSFSWDILLLCAETYPCLWYCIPIVKSILGSVMAQCEGSVVKSNFKMPDHILKLLDRWFFLMRKGKILPETLSYLYEVLPLVSQYEAFTVLSDIWGYFQHITPDKNKLNQHFEYLQLRLDAEEGNRITGRPAEFMEASRYVLQANIATLGWLFPKLFTVDSELK